MSLTETGALVASNAPATVDAADLRAGAMRGGFDDMVLPIQVIWWDGSPMVLVGWGMRLLRRRASVQRRWPSRAAASLSETPSMSSRYTRASKPGVSRVASAMMSVESVWARAGEAFQPRASAWIR